MKRTRAATKAGDGATADDGNVKPASRRVKVKVMQSVLRQQSALSRDPRSLSCRSTVLRSCLEQRPVMSLMRLRVFWSAYCIPNTKWSLTVDTG